MWRKTVSLVSFGILWGACLFFWFFRCYSPSPGPQEDGPESDKEEILTLKYSELCSGTRRALQRSFSAALGDALRQAGKDPTLQHEMKLLSYIDDTFDWTISISIWLVKPGNRWEVLRNDSVNHDGTKSRVVVLSAPIGKAVALLW